MPLLAIVDSTLHRASHRRLFRILSPRVIPSFRRREFLLEVIMKKFLVRPVIAFALMLGVALPVLADTIRLKDGSVIRGQIVSFKNEQFTIMVGAGARGRKSRITVYMEDVDSIEFDNAGNAGPADDNSSNSNQPVYQPPTNTQNNRPTTNQPTYQPPTDTNTQPSANPTFFQINVKVRADNSSNGWTNSGLVVRRGQRLRISATGRVSLGANRYSTPDGVPNITDRDKLMRNQPTGGLIAVIGDANADFIFVASSRDLVGQRHGGLFPGVSEGR